MGSEWDDALIGLRQDFQPTKEVLEGYLDCRRFGRCGYETAKGRREGERRATEKLSNELSLWVEGRIIQRSSILSIPIPMYHTESRGPEIQIANTSPTNMNIALRVETR